MKLPRTVATAISVLNRDGHTNIDCLLKWQCRERALQKLNLSGNANKRSACISCTTKTVSVVAPAAFTEVRTICVYTTLDERKAHERRRARMDGGDTVCSLDWTNPNTIKKRLVGNRPKRCQLHKESESQSAFFHWPYKQGQTLESGG